MLFALGLHKETPRNDMDFIELQLCRRCYWSVYTSDKWVYRLETEADDRTDALSGSPIALNDFEGSPPLPLEVDDEYMTPEGHLPEQAILHVRLRLSPQTFPDHVGVSRQTTNVRPYAHSRSRNRDSKTMDRAGSGAGQGCSQ